MGAPKNPPANRDEAMELHGCPFCGGEGKLDEQCGYWAVFCRECKAITGYAAESAEAATAEWNARPFEDALYRVLRDLELYLRNTPHHNAVEAAAARAAISSARGGQ